MDRKHAREALGLDPGCTDEAVKQTYASLSRIFKRRIVESQSIEERKKQQRGLLNLIELRDLALEVKPEQRVPRVAVPRVDDDWTPQRGVPRGVRQRPTALAFFDVGRPADEATLEAVFFTRSRALKAVIARAASDSELQESQEALARLNRIYRIATEPPSVCDEVIATLGGDDEDVAGLEDTMTDALPTQERVPETDPVPAAALPRRAAHNEDLADSISNFQIPPDAFTF